MISTVGFGLPMSWSEPERNVKGELSVQATIFRVANYIIERAAMPRWLYYLGLEKLKVIEEAYNRFGTLMHSLVDERSKQLDKLRGTASEEEFAENIKDVLGRLVNSRRTEVKNSLNEEEIIGNCFVFVRDGNELAFQLCIDNVSSDICWTW